MIKKVIILATLFIVIPLAVAIGRSGGSQTTIVEATNTPVPPVPQSLKPEIISLYHLMNIIQSQGNIAGRLKVTSQDELATATADKYLARYVADSEILSEMFTKYVFTEPADVEYLAYIQQQDAAVSGAYSFQLNLVQGKEFDATSIKYLREITQMIVDLTSSGQIFFGDSPEDTEKIKNINSAQSALLL
jgi:hypothetical protein